MARSPFAGHADLSAAEREHAMSLRSIAFKSIVVSGAGAAALVALTASPAMANTVSHGVFSCGPDTVVDISWTLSGTATSSLTFSYPDASGKLQTVTRKFGAAKTFASKTGQRTIDVWSVTSSKTVTFTGGSCV
jgi:hypothetical protein